MMSECNSAIFSDIPTLTAKNQNLVVTFLDPTFGCWIIERSFHVWVGRYQNVIL